MPRDSSDLPVKQWYGYLVAIKSESPLNPTTMEAALLHYLPAYEGAEAYAVEVEAMGPIDCYETKEQDATRS